MRMLTLLRQHPYRARCCCLRRLAPGPALQLLQTRTRPKRSHPIRRLRRCQAPCQVPVTAVSGATPQEKRAETAAAHCSCLPVLMSRGICPPQWQQQQQQKLQ